MSLSVTGRIVVFIQMRWVASGKFQGEKWHALTRFKSISLVTVSVTDYRYLRGERKVS